MTVFAQTRLLRPLLLWPLLLSACAPPLDTDKPLLPRPQVLPSFATFPDKAEPFQLATTLAAEGRAKLAAGDLQGALPLMVKALQASPAHPEARLGLALVYEKAGLGSVALDLLRPLKAAVATCGLCRYVLQAAAKSPDFARLAQTKEGAALFADLPPALDFAATAQKLATALQTGDPDKCESWAHPKMPFDLVRSCPSCPQPAQQERARRPLMGGSMMAKLALRFNTVNPQLRGIRLTAGPAATCQERCCTWPLPKPVPENTAALARVCLLPTDATSAVASEIEAVYGTPTVAPVAAPAPAPARAPAPAPVPVPAPAAAPK